MAMMSIDNLLWLGYIVTEAVVVGVLIYRRAWRVLPLFCVYCAWDVLSNLSIFTLQYVNVFSPSSNQYLAVYILQTIIDAVLQFCVLVELAWSVLRPVRASLPRFTLFLLTGMILILGFAVWQIPAPIDAVTFTANAYLMPLFHLEQTVAILRILFFLGMAGCSQLLSIGWRDRELQVATGMGIYSICSLAITFLQASERHMAQYAHINQLNHISVASFQCCLLYWIFSFAQKEPERREFTPQMQNLLLAVAGVARAERAALADASKKKQ
jgi:hypothetical protein